MSSPKLRAVKYDGPWPEIPGLPKPRLHFYKTKIGQLYYLIFGAVVALMLGILLNALTYGGMKLQHLNPWYALIISLLVLGYSYLGIMDLFALGLTYVMDGIFGAKYPRMREARSISHLVVFKSLNEIKALLLAVTPVLQAVKIKEGWDENTWGTILIRRWWGLSYADRTLIVIQKKDAHSCEVFIALENALPMWVGMDGMLGHHKTLSLLLQAMDAEDGRYES